MNILKLTTSHLHPLTNGSKAIRSSGLDDAPLVPAAACYNARCAEVVGVQSASCRHTFKSLSVVFSGCLRMRSRLSARSYLISKQQRRRRLVAATRTTPEFAVSVSRRRRKSRATASCDYGYFVSSRKGILYSKCNLKQRVRRLEDAARTASSSEEDRVCGVATPTTVASPWERNGMGGASVHRTNRNARKGRRRRGWMRQRPTTQK